MARSSETPPDYQVPALDKGLDILECLAEQNIPLTQAQISRALGRGPNELFRMLVALERRGYIQRDPASGAYTLTLRLFELSRTHSPFHGLLRAAAQPMRQLTETVLESCHLGVLQRGQVLVLAQEESPRRIRLSVAVGGMFPVVHTASGRLLLAHLPQAERDELLHHDPGYLELPTTEQNALLQRIETIQARGYEEAHDEKTEGVRDLAVLVGHPAGQVKAALTIAILRRTKEQPRADLLAALQHCALEIGQLAGLVVRQNED